MTGPATRVFRGIIQSIELSSALLEISNTGVHLVIGHLRKRSWA